MHFFAVRNLTEQSLTVCEPWAFTVTEDITAQIRGDKQRRQEFYQTPTTRHCFYTTIEPSNPNQRPSKENNPPRLLHGFAVDYDAKIPDARIDEAVASMPVKPAWIERSLGGGCRLVWTMEAPLGVDSYDFAVFLLQRAIKWLALDMLPCLDQGAFTDPTRLLCNGGEWRATGHGAIPAMVLQGFYVEAARAFNFRGSDGPEAPLDVVEAELRRRFPNFSWPVDFALETQGPTFWVEGSTSPLSAIVKKAGMFTFSAHAGKSFFTWADLLGAEFIREFSTNAIAKATSDVWWDGKKFWRRKQGSYVSLEKDELLNFFEVTCRLNGKPDKSGVSAIKEAFNHIYEQNSIDCAVPFVCRKFGPTEHLGVRKLNTWINRCVRPADELSAWGSEGKFPLLAEILDHLFSPHEQLPHFLAWWKYYYESALNETPRPGQNTFLMGGVNAGKTLVNREFVGVSVGGYADASSYLIKGGAFNSHLISVPHWAVDDEAMSESEQARQNFQSAIKKMAANPSHAYNKKFEAEGMTEWMGRVVITSNLDFVSSRNMGTMDDSSGDKTNLFRCATNSTMQFPERPVLIATLKRELPFLLRWLVDWEVPAEIPRDTRFGFAPHHEASLVEQAHQGSKAAPFVELLVESLREYFEGNPQVAEWRGTVTQLTRLLHTNPLNDNVIRTLRLEQAHRYLEMIQRSKRVICLTTTDDFGSRVWVFPRQFSSGAAIPATPETSQPVAQQSNSKWTTK